MTVTNTLYLVLLYADLHGARTLRRGAGFTQSIGHTAQSIKKLRSVRRCKAAFLGRPNKQFHIATNYFVMVVGHFNALAVADALNLINIDALGIVVFNLDVMVLLRMDINFFIICFVFES